MAKNQANSSQIKDLAILGRHIGLKEVDGTHIKDEVIESKHIALASIEDKHLKIDWSAKASAILQAKLVVDYVQAAQAVAVATSSESVKVTAAISAPLATQQSPKGVVVESGKNVVIIRTESDITEPIRDTDGEEVKGHITHDGTDFVISFYTNKAGVEVPFEFSSDASIVFQYPQRFDFESVSEMFGANEKFVDYGVDTSTRFDITQLVADIFGDTYVLNGDGTGNHATALLAHVEAHADAIAAIEVSVGEIDTKITEHTEAIAAIDGKIETLTTKSNSAMSTIGEVQTEVEDLTDRVVVLENARVTMKRNDKKFTSDDLVDDAYTFHFVASEEELPLTGQFDIYYNGMLQLAGVHYNEDEVDGEIVRSITFAPEAIAEGDIVQARWFV